MKERKISRRAVCSAMVASLALGVLEGCGSSSSTTASSAAGSGAAASNERITVRILKSKAANEVAAEQMDVWKVRAKNSIWILNLITPRRTITTSA